MANDLDFLDSLGLSQTDLSQPESAYDKFILGLANEVTAQFQEYITENASNTGALAASVVYFPTGAMSFEIQADEYYKFQDQGVNPIGQQKYPTPYQFKLPYVTKNHAQAIREWKGYDMSHAYASAAATKFKYGLKPRNITDNVMNDDVLNRIANDLATVTGLMFEVSFTKNTRTWQ
jgi:hypothetical protein